MYQRLILVSTDLLLLRGLGLTHTETFVRRTCSLMKVGFILVILRLHIVHSVQNDHSTKTRQPQHYHFTCTWGKSLWSVTNRKRPDYDQSTQLVITGNSRSYDKLLFLFFSFKRVTLSDNTFLMHVLRAGTSTKQLRLLICSRKWI